MKKIVLNLGNSFQGLVADARRYVGGDAEIVVLALRRDSEPFRDEAPLTERSGAAASGAQIVVIDAEDFDPCQLGAELDEALVVMNGGTARNGWACVRIFDGLKAGELVNLQRDFVDVLDRK